MSDREIRIVLIGKTGCGKSTTGNSILGKSAFAKAGGLRAGTSQCQLGSSEYGGHDLVVVDTPGVYDSDHADQETITEILKCLAMASPGPHVFLWILKATDRFSNRDADIFKIMKSMFGENVKNYLVLVFTHVDAFEGDFTQELRDPPDALNEILMAVENRWVAISNKEEGAQVLMQKLIGVITDVKSSRRVHFSNDLTRDVEAHVERRLRELKKAHNIDTDAAKEKFRKGLQTGEESVLLKLLFTTLGGLVGGALGGVVGFSAGPVAATVTAGVGATAGAAVGSLVAKKCSIM